jgi:uncharacterized protein YndB with AHSA1/START domain
MRAQKITIDAPVERVWKDYTTPTDMTQWNFASDDWCCPSAEADLKVGGTYKARMEAKNGSFGFDLEAVYEEVEPHEALTMVMSGGRKARTTFESAGGKTKVPPLSTRKLRTQSTCSATAGRRS